MKIKYFTLPFLFILLALFSHAQDNVAKPTQFLLIVRSKTAPPSKELMAANIKHWQEFMGGLGRQGILVAGYRPRNEGVTLSGVDKTEKPGSYLANDEMVSSFLLINAPDLEKAKEIASRCPVFELQGSVEIRPMQAAVK